MSKKSIIKKCSQFPNTISIVLITVLVTAFVVSSGMYLWQSGSGAKMEYNLKSEVNRLNERILSIATADKREAEKEIVLEAAPVETVSIGEEQPQADVRFESCGQLSLFVYEDWYADFRDGLKKQFAEPSDITSACYSDSGNMFIALAYTDYCIPPNLFKFNTATKTLGRARINGKGVKCISSPEIFGRRDGNVIKLVGTDENEKCEWENHYDYNFLNNTLELKRQYFICEGESEGKWTEY